MSEPISTLLFRNVAGRCGRAGVFTEGDTIIFDNPLGKLRFTAERVRRKQQSDIFLTETMSPLRSSIESIPSPPDADLRYGVLSSQFMAAIPENTEDDNLAQSFASETFAARRNSNSVPTQEKIDSIVRSLLDPSEGALATMNSPLSLTEFGEAGKLTGFSSLSCRHIRGFLNSYFQPRMFLEMDEFCAEALRALAALPEQSDRYLPKIVANKRAAIGIKESDLQTVIAKWLAGNSLETVFASLPYTRRSSITPGIEEWLKGLTVPSRWDSEYEKFLDFTSRVLQSFLPWVLWSCEHLQFWHERIRRTDWPMWSRMMEHGVNTPWAVEMLEAGAPGNRTAVMAVARHLPEHFPSYVGQEGEGIFSSDNNTSIIEAAFDTAYDDAGETGAALRRDIQRFQTWLWGRAGLTIFPRY